MRQNGFLGLFKRGDGLVPAHGREIGEEFGQRLAFLQVVDQSLERNTGADEDRRPLEDFGVSVDCALMFHSSVSWKLRRGSNAGISLIPRGFQAYASPSCASIH